MNIITPEKDMFSHENVLSLISKYAVMYTENILPKLIAKAVCEIEQDFSTVENESKGLSYCQWLSVKLSDGCKYEDIDPDLAECLENCLNEKIMALSFIDHFLFMIGADQLADIHEYKTREEFEYANLIFQNYIKNQSKTDAVENYRKAQKEIEDRESKEKALPEGCRYATKEEIQEIFNARRTPQSIESIKVDLSKLPKVAKRMSTERALKYGLSICDRENWPYNETNVMSALNQLEMEF